MRWQPLTANVILPPSLRRRCRRHCRMPWFGLPSKTCESHAEEQCETIGMLPCSRDNVCTGIGNDTGRNLFTPFYIIYSKHGIALTQITWLCAFVAFISYIWLNFTRFCFICLVVVNPQNPHTSALVRSSFVRKSITFARSTHSIPRKQRWELT